MYEANKLLNSFIRATLLISLTTTTSISLAAAPKDITQKEVELLPSYCPYTQSFKFGIKYGMDNHPLATRWSNTIGPGFMHLHHYCWALIEMHRASKATTPDETKRALRISAIDNLWYVVNNSPNDLVLLPEIYTWIGKAEISIGRPEQAHIAFEKSRNIKPDYWPAYYHWGEYLLSKNKLSEAITITQKGLRKSPDSKPLQELLKTLNKVTPSYIEH